MDIGADPAVEDVEVDYEADDDEDEVNAANVVLTSASAPINKEVDVSVDSKRATHDQSSSKRNVNNDGSAGGMGGMNMQQNDRHNNRVEETPSKRARIDEAAAARVIKNHPDKLDKLPRKSHRTENSTPTQLSSQSQASSNRNAITSGSGSYGIYVPPFRRKELERQAAAEAEKENGEELNNKDASTSTIATPSIQQQRQKWEQLKKSINGTINRLNTITIKDLIHTLFQNANLVRGKGLLAKAVLRAATTSPTYAPVYASLLAVVNTKLPEIGELILVRAILTFRRSYARQDRGITMSITNFIGCLFNQGICHELLCLQLLTVLLEGDPTDDSVEVAVQFIKVVGMALIESSPAGVHAVMERFRGLLHDGRIGRRVQFKIEELMKVKRDRFREFPALQEELDLVERDEQITFELGLDDEGLEKEETLDIFKYDSDWGANEQDWIEIRREILGEDSDDEGSSDGDGESETDDEGSNGDDSDDEEDGILPEAAPAVPLSTVNNKQITEIHDMSEKDLINLRRTIYLTIMSSATFEECSHKLSKMDIPLGKEMELINMVIECCSQERTFLMYYGMIAARFCLMHKRWSDAFHQAFIDQYNTIHRLETNKLRNVAKMFAHLLHTDSLSWSCLATVHLNEDETTSSSRIFLKIVVQEMAAAIGIEKLVKRFETDDPDASEWYKELFPKDNPRKTRYAINFFTSIGLGPLTDGLREHLKNAPKLIMMQAQAEAAKLKAKVGIDSDDSSVLSSSSSDSSSLSSSSKSSSSRGSHSSYTSDSYSSDDSFTSSSDESSHRRGRKGRSDRRRKRSYSSDTSATSYDRSRSPHKKSDRKSERVSTRSTSTSRSESRRKKRQGGDSSGKGDSSSRKRDNFSPIGSVIGTRESRSYSRSRSRSLSPRDRRGNGKDAVKSTETKKIPSRKKDQKKRSSRSNSYSSDDSSRGNSSQRNSRKRSFSRSPSRNRTNKRIARDKTKGTGRRSNYT